MTAVRCKSFHGMEVPCHDGIEHNSRLTTA
jgi:hypothetical protein